MPMEQLLVISFFSGMATGLGGLIVLWFGKPGPGVLALYLGIAAGMMGLLVFVDLIPSSLKYGNVYFTLIGLIIGILLMIFFDKILSGFFPDPGLKTRQFVGEKNYLHMGYFFTLAIALHNIPEGIAIGAGYESQTELGIRVAIIIAIHNIPEGLGVASTLYLGGLSSRNVFLLPFATGLFIPIGAIISAIIGGIFSYWISIGLSLASGAMLYLVLTEVGPECLRLNKLSGEIGIAIGILILYIVYTLQ